MPSHDASDLSPMCLAPARTTFAGPTTSHRASDANGALIAASHALPGSRLGRRRAVPSLVSRPPRPRGSGVVGGERTAVERVVRSWGYSSTLTVCCGAVAVGAARGQEASEDALGSSSLVLLLLRLLVLICSVTAIVAAGLVLPVVASCFTGSARPTPPRRLYEELSAIVQSEVVLWWICPFAKLAHRP